MSPEVKEKVAYARHRPGDHSPFAIGLVTRQAHARATQALVEALRPLGLELRHFAVMISLAEHGAVIQRDLATMSGTDKATMVRVVDDLERASYAVRRPVARDRRLASVELTDEGRSAFDAAHQAAAPLLDRLFAHMSRREADQLLTLLDKFTYPEHESTPG